MGSPDRTLYVSCARVVGPSTSVDRCPQDRRGSAPPPSVPHRPTVRFETRLSVPTAHPHTRMWVNVRVRARQSLCVCDVYVYSFVCVFVSVRGFLYSRVYVCPAKDVEREQEVHERSWALRKTTPVTKRDILEDYPSLPEDRVHGSFPDVVPTHLPTSLLPILT